MFDPARTILAGMDTAGLQARLTALQAVYLDLSGGASVASASYTQGDGSKTVTYRALDLANLTQAIRLLQAQLGIVCSPRRPMRVRFT